MNISPSYGQLKVENLPILFLTYNPDRDPDLKHDIISKFIRPPDNSGSIMFCHRPFIFNY